jgi:hypothetical protein
MYVHNIISGNHLLARTPLLIISPTLAKSASFQAAPNINGGAADVATMAGGYSTLYPIIYAGDAYNIAFRIGKLYPMNRRYLSIFLTTCQIAEKPDKRSMRFIRTVACKQ